MEVGNDLVKYSHRLDFNIFFLSAAHQQEIACSKPVESP